MNHEEELEHAKLALLDMNRLLEHYKFNLIHAWKSKESDAISQQLIVSSLKYAALTIKKRISEIE